MKTLKTDGYLSIGKIRFGFKDIKIFTILNLLALLVMVFYLRYFPHEKIILIFFVVMGLVVVNILLSFYIMSYSTVVYCSKNGLKTKNFMDNFLDRNMETYSLGSDGYICKSEGSGILLLVTLNYEKGWYMLKCNEIRDK